MTSLGALKLPPSSLTSHHRCQAAPLPPELRRLDKKHHRSRLVLPHPSSWLEDHRSVVLIEDHRVREQVGIVNPRRCPLEPLSPWERIPTTTALFCTGKSPPPCPVAAAPLTPVRTGHGATGLCLAPPPTPLSHPGHSSPRQHSRIDQGIPVRRIESWPPYLKGTPYI
jgi:hypothetical protein